MLFVDTPGLDAATARLRELAAQGKDLGPALAEIGEEEVTNILLRFEREEDPQGNPWEPFADNSPRLLEDGKLLQDTGRLKGSIQAQVLGGSVLLVGSNVKYAPFHQFGTVFIPARPFLGVSDDLKDAIADILHAHFNL